MEGSIRAKSSKGEGKPSLIFWEGDKLKMKVGKYAAFSLGRVPTIKSWQKMLSLKHGNKRGDIRENQAHIARPARQGNG